MKIIPRSEAILLASFLSMLSLAEDEQVKEMQNAMDEIGTGDASELEKSIILREYLQQRYGCYTNRYIQDFLTDKLKVSLTVSGADVNLYSCPCCGYKTLNELGEYFICGVCYWEDDGSFEATTISTVNRMTLEEAKNNFHKYGVVSEIHIMMVDDTRFLKYSLSN